MFPQVGDFKKEHTRMRKAEVVFEEGPRHEKYGMVAAFQDFMAISGTVSARILLAKHSSLEDMDSDWPLFSHGCRTGISDGI